MLQGPMVAKETNSLLGIKQLNSYGGTPAVVDAINGEAVSETTEKEGTEDDDGHEQTTEWQTFIHLIKGYIGPGCLSLPWAVSQLGIPGGVIAIFVMALWSSYNCWIVVKLKRHIERAARPTDDKASEVSSATTNTSVTYPDLGEWAYGKSFQDYISVCICTQQLAICTVYISFTGENLLAVLREVGSRFLTSHVGVITLVLPFAMGLSYFPNLRTLAPVTLLGTIFLLTSFAALGAIVGKEWDNRPAEHPTIDIHEAPLGLCAILYSFEGVCLILPVESAMKEPQKFQRVFFGTMALVAVVMVSVAVICILAFGEVTNGSVTAFLLEEYGDDDSILFWILVANTVASLSVLLTYPLQLFPSLELIAPWVEKNHCWSNTKNCCNNNAAKDDEDDNLSDFEPLPALPEHDTYSVGSFPEHQYDEWESEFPEKNDDEMGDDADQMSRQSTAKASIVSILPRMTMPGDSLAMRSGLVLLTYILAVVIPNVEAMISLAGAVAGSSTALLIPPLLELAWIKSMEDRAATQELAAADQGLDGNDEKADELSRWSLPAMGKQQKGNWWIEKLICYVLLFFGFIFFAIGTSASIADIVAIYRTSQ